MLALAACGEETGDASSGASTSSGASASGAGGGGAGSGGAGGAGGSAAECTTPADCRLEASYCGGCACLSLAPGEAAPKCSDTVVTNCESDPCAGAEPACIAGACDRADVAD